MRGGEPGQQQVPKEAPLTQELRRTNRSDEPGAELPPGTDMNPRAPFAPDLAAARRTEGPERSDMLPPRQSGLPVPSGGRRKLA